VESTHLLNRLSQYNLLAPAEHFVRNLVSPNRKAVFSVSVLCLLTYGFVAYNHTFAGDDWPAVIQQGFMYEWTISMGRPLHSLTWILGGDNYLAPAFTLTVMIASLLIAGLIISLPLRLTEELNVFIFLSLIVLCPIWVEHVNFKLNHLAVALAAISTAGASVAIWKATTTDPEYVVSRSRSIIYILIASLLFTVAAATRQEMLIFGLTGILLIVLRDLPRSHKPVKMFTMTISAALIAAVICIGLYAALVAFTRYLFDVSPPPPGSPYRITSSLIGNMEDVTLVLERFRAYFCQFLFSEQHLFPASVKYIFLGSIALLIVGIYRFVLRKYQFHKRAFAVTLWSTFAITALLILPWIIGLIRTPNSYRYSGILPELSCSRSSIKRIGC
jgi:hypothetical protein